MFIIIVLRLSSDKLFSMQFLLLSLPSDQSRDVTPRFIAGGWMIFHFRFFQFIFFLVNWISLYFLYLLYSANMLGLLIVY